MSFQTASRQTTGRTEERSSSTTYSCATAKVCLSPCRASTSGSCRRRRSALWEGLGQVRVSCSTSCLLLSFVVGGWWLVSGGWWLVLSVVVCCLWLVATVGWFVASVECCCLWLLATVECCRLFVVGGYCLLLSFVCGWWLLSSVVVVCRLWLVANVESCCRLLFVVGG